MDNRSEKMKVETYWICDIEFDIEEKDYWTYMDEFDRTLVSDTLDGLKTKIDKFKAEFLGLETLHYEGVE